MANHTKPSPTWSPERAAKQLSLFRSVIAGADRLGVSISMPIQAANTFMNRCSLHGWPDLKTAVNTDIHWDLPGQVRFTSRPPLALPCAVVLPLISDH